MKRKTLPKGFLSTNGEPTDNSIQMYFVYLSNIPKGWDMKNINEDAVQKVRDYFGVDYGFENMIRWGLQHGCCKSKTSSGRHNSMSKACVLAQGLIGAGVKLSNVRLAA
jgi:hypothetical protein